MKVNNKVVAEKGFNGLSCSINFLDDEHHEQQLKTEFSVINEWNFSEHFKGDREFSATKSDKQHTYVSLPFLGLHQSSISPDKGEEWQERTVLLLYFNWLVNLLSRFL